MWGKDGAGQEPQEAHQEARKPCSTGGRERRGGEPVVGTDDGGRRDGGQEGPSRYEAMFYRRWGADRGASRVGDYCCPPTSDARLPCGCRDPAGGGEKEGAGCPVSPRIPRPRGWDRAPSVDSASSSASPPLMLSLSLSKQRHRDKCNPLNKKAGDGSGGQWPRGHRW